MRNVTFHLYFFGHKSTVTQTILGCSMESLIIWEYYIICIVGDAFAAMNAHLIMNCSNLHIYRKYFNLIPQKRLIVS